MNIKSRVLAGIVVAGLMAAPAAAQLIAPVLVNDALGNFKWAQQLVNQGTQLVNEAKNLAQLPQLTLGNIQGEVQSVAAQGANIPAQFRGIVASAQILRNTPIDATRTQQTQAQIGSATGAVSQLQISNQQLGNIAGSLQQKNAADAAQTQADFANKSDFAGDLMTLSGNNSASVPNTTRPM
jgi:hypothetical protein